MSAPKSLILPGDHPPPPPSTVLRLGPHALRAYRGTPPPEPEKKPTVTAGVEYVNQGPNRKTAGKRKAGAQC